MADRDDDTPNGAPDMAELARRTLDLWQEQMTALAADPTAMGEWAKLWQAAMAPAAAPGQAPHPTAPANPMAGPMAGPMAAMMPWLASMPGFAPPFGGNPAPAPASAHDTTAPPGPQAASAASDGSTDAVAALARRIDELERRIDALAGSSGGGGGGRRKRGGGSGRKTGAGKRTGKPGE
jgi:hypothetical protein